MIVARAWEGFLTTWNIKIAQSPSGIIAPSGRDPRSDKAGVRSREVSLAKKIKNNHAVFRV